METRGGGYEHKYQIGSQRQNIGFGSTFDDIRSIHGSFATVIENDEKVMLVVDLIASFPLFYTVAKDTIFISDDAVAIANEAKKNFDEGNVEEFLKTGFVTEKGTLFQDVFGLNPGTYVLLDKISGETDEYAWFQLAYHKQSVGKNKDCLMEEFDTIMTEVVSDLIDRLAGRTALIPLSGGCDSRTIAAYLKKMNYENVICFSYGKAGNWETKRSQSIAEYLGCQWFFAEYSADKWKQFLNSVQYKDFALKSCRGRNIGCIQALPAILEIKKKGIVSDNAVVVPGHALDFTMGSHLNREWSQCGKEKLINIILRDHYCLRDALERNGNISKWTDMLNVVEGETAVSNAYMCWEYHNRQSKFIANDVRAYEYAGYSYELPFWDIRIQKFAMGLPYDLLYGRRFQYLFTKMFVDPIVGVDFDYKVPPAYVDIIKTWLKKFYMVQRLLEKRKGDVRFLDTNAFLAWITDEEYGDYLVKFGKGFNLNSIEADDVIKMYKGMIK